MPLTPTFPIRKLSGRKKRFCVDVPATVSSLGRRERRFFETEAEAKSFVALEKTRLVNFGTAISHLAPEVRRDAARALKLLEPFDVTLIDPVESVAELSHCTRREMPQITRRKPSVFPTDSHFATEAVPRRC